MKARPARHVAQALQAGRLSERVQVRQQRRLIEHVVVAWEERKTYQPNVDFMTGIKPKTICWRRIQM